MILHNPTKNEVEIIYEGTVYLIEANKSKEIPDNVAKHWVKNVHKFIEIETETTKPSDVSIIEKTETVEKIKKEIKKK